MSDLWLGDYRALSDPTIGRDPSNWLVIPPEPPPQFWLEPAYTGMPASPELVTLQAQLDAAERGEAPSFDDEQMYAYHRERGKRDLLFFGKFVLQFDRLQTDLHAGLAWAWQCPDGTALTRGPAGLYRWATMPRGHLKTTLLTITTALWLLLRDPDERILIYSANATLAQKMFGLIRRFLEGQGEAGQFFLQCYPELRTSRSERDKWAHNALTVPRPTPYTDHSLEASGIGAIITGSHFTTELVDDVVGKLETPEQMAKILDTLDNLTPLLDSLETGRRRLACTPWPSLGGGGGPDQYAEKHDPEALVARRCLFEERDPTAPQGRRPITRPEEFTEERLIFRWRPSMARTVAHAKKLAKRSPFFMSCQYFCFPKAEGRMGFKRQWFRYFVRRGDVLVELDQDGREQKKVPLTLCNVFITVDPIGGEKRSAAGGPVVDPRGSMESDSVGIAVVAVSEDNIWYVLDIRNERYNDDEFINTLFELVAYYRPQLTAIEGTAGQRWIFGNFVREWRRGRPVFALGEWKGGGVGKEERIRGLIPRTSEGFLLFRAQAPEAIQEGIDVVIDQLLNPGPPDDAKDALAAMQQIAYPPGAQRIADTAARLNAFGEDDELLRLDPGSRRVWLLQAKKHDERFGLGPDFFLGGANA